MISELMRVAEASGLAGCESRRQRPVHWIIDLDAEGRGIGFSPTTVTVETKRGEKKERRGKKFAVSANYHMQWKDGKIQSVCTNQHNWLPDFLTGPANEIFPHGVTGKTPVAQKQSLWAGRIFEAAETLPANTNIQALSVWLKHGPRFDDLALPCEKEERQRIIEDLDAGKETISFRVAGRLITADLELRQWWAERVTQQREEVIKKLKSGRDNYSEGIGPITEYFPSVFGSVPFASFNAAPFISYGLGSQTATFRLETAEKTAAGLNALLHDSRTSLWLGDETAVFWAVDRTNGKVQPADFLRLLDQPDPLAVRDYLKSIWGSRPSELAQTDFHVAILLKGTGRFSVRSWHTDTLADADEHVRHYFAAIQLESDDATPALRDMASATITKARKQKAKPTSATFNALFEAAWRGTTLPYSLLATAICRQKLELASGDPDDLDFRKRLQARTALLQLYFTLKNDGTTTTQETIMNTKETAILCGRLLAILDKIHDEAHNGKSASSPANRLYGAASATPALVFPKLCQLARYHLQKIGGGWARVLEFGVPKEKREDGFPEDFDGLAAIVAHLKETTEGNFPRLLSLEDQERFALGFYYERCRKWPGYKKTDSTKLQTNNLETK
jgi:CRISPR-associated protein Csd1